MDLPTCPACGQSVIDDDATNCPFCDAPMSGEPVRGGAKPAPQTPTPSASGRPPASAATPATSTQPAAAAKDHGAQDHGAQDDGGEDETDPFDIDTVVGKNVVAVRPKPSQGRSHKVVCPMCDSSGFISRKAAGRDVRCCNSDCMVPVFTAPPLEIDERAESADAVESSSASSLMIGIGVGAALLAVGGAIWYFASGDSQTKSPNSIATGPSMLDDNDVDDQAEPPPDTKPKTTAAKNPQVIPLTELKALAIKRMVAAAQEQKNNRSKPFCRQMCAESFAHFGDLKSVDEQLRQLVKVGPRQAHYQIRPLTVVAWRHLEQGNDVAAQQTVDGAWKLAGYLPNYGRVPIDLSTALAAVLVRLGRVDDARRLIAEHRNSQSAGQLSAAIEMRRAFESANQGLPFRRALSPWADPQAVAVTAILAAHRRFEESRDWARGTAEGRTRTECLMVWAQCVAHAACVTKNPKQLEILKPVTTAMDPAGRARLFAGVAIVQRDCGNPQAADDSLKLAQEALNAVTVPQPMELPDTRGILGIKLPSSESLVNAAVAATEVSRAQAIANQKEAAWQSLGKSIQFCEGIAPRKTDVDEHMQLVQQAGDQLLGQLQSELELDNADQARIAVRNYRKSMQNIAEASAQSFQLQVKLLQHSVSWGMHESIWDVIDPPPADASERSPLLQTSLPFFLIHAFARDEKNQKAADVLKAIRALASDRNPQPQDDLELAARVQAANQKYAAAARTIEDNKQVNAEWDEWKLQLALDLIDVLLSKQSVKAALTFVQAIKNEVWRELLLAEVTAVATRDGRGHAVWKFAQDNKLSPTEQVAVYRSLLIGISLIPPQPSAEETPPAE